MECADLDIFGGGFINRFGCLYPDEILDLLLLDHTTGRNIVWADNEYVALGEGFLGDDEITVDKIAGPNIDVIKPRAAKEQDWQSQRTKRRAEVFTPSWLCNQMNNDVDEVWFGRRDVFTIEGEHSWQPNSEPVKFPRAKGRDWRAYIDSPRLEITCGEAAYVCSRYDSATGEPLRVADRVGYLDRKLRVVSERAKSREEWACFALEALAACYGFEYQGDNLLIARVNVFESYCEHFFDRWHVSPDKDDLKRAASIISWNFWQMDGLTDALPTTQRDAIVESTLGMAPLSISGIEQLSIFGTFDIGGDLKCSGASRSCRRVPLSVIYDWKRDEPFEFAALKGGSNFMDKRFYAVIGNPPFQGEKNDNDRKPPMYHTFMDSAYEVGDLVELVTPARFLFEAGQTPKWWNQKMLSDEHLKVVKYKADASEVFPGPDIKGGIAVTLRDANKVLGPIGTFTIYPELNGILKKVEDVSGDSPRLNKLIASQRCYKFSPLFYRENVSNPNVVSLLDKGGKIKIVSKVMEVLPEFFLPSSMSTDGDDLKFYGRVDGKRGYRYIAKKYICDNKYIDAYKLLIPEANGAGVYGECLSEPIVAGPGVGSADTFLNAGPFETEEEAKNLGRYYRTKFFRALLGVKKATQHSPSLVWCAIPQQDFSVHSDIDWAKPLSDIDGQLYRKYGLNEDEVAFVESHVKEMS